MVDTEYLKKKCAEYSTSDLLKYIFLQSEDFVPEAIEVFKNEFEKRESDLQELLKKESSKTGLIEHTILRTQHHYHGLKQIVTGNTYLTSKGLFFIPESIVDEGPYPYGVGAFSLGPLGLILDEIALSFSHKEFFTNVKSKNLPLSLLARIVKYSYCAYINEIENVKCWKRGLIRIKNRANAENDLAFEKTEMPIVKNWLSSKQISCSHKKTISEIILDKVKVKKEILFNRNDSKSLHKRLEDLKKAFERGLISEKEYEEKRKKIIENY